MIAKHVGVISLSALQKLFYGLVGAEVESYPTAVLLQPVTVDFHFFPVEVK